MGILTEKYSVLMSVYAKEKPEHLRASIDSILKQTVSADDFVLVCDGFLTPELEEVISELGGGLNVVRLSENVGLAAALAAGLLHCANDLVMRMDSDDVAVPTRAEKQLLAMENADLCGGTAAEFERDIADSVSRRELPSGHDEIVRFARRRNPFNHPTVMFRKSLVEKAGGYSGDFPLAEDYYLWVRMISAGARCANVSDVLVYMRVGDGLYKRRSGRKYYKDMKKFYRYLYKSGFSAYKDYFICTRAQLMGSLFPKLTRKLLRK